MWYKITNLKSENLTNPQIALQLGVHRTTVSRYLSMSEEEFLQSQSYQRSYPRLLDAYEQHVLHQLERCNDLSASQIHDRLKEVFPDLPSVNEKTVYNFVQKVRKRYDIIKSNPIRDYQKCIETPYGEYAQVDFGERYLQDTSGHSKKVYFFAMVLSRSRTKFIFFSATPFNSELSVYAHELAFEYFGGVPHQIIYDQDKVFIVKENFGHYVLTSTFDTYVSHSCFKPIFCRKEDPESKGKCENVIKYVKNNFLRGRTFIDIQQLNQEGLAWLSRTGNGKMHAGTRKIPAEVLTIEKEHLLPYKGTPCMPAVQMGIYKVRKDHTIHYKGCYYSVPIKTYINDKSICFVEEKQGVLLIYNQQTGKQIGMHKIPIEKGQFILEPAHHVVNTYKYPELENRIYKQIGQDEFIRDYLQMIRQERPRYYCDSLRHILKHISWTPRTLLRETIMEMMAEQIYNPQILTECLHNKQLKQSRVVPKLDKEAHLPDREVIQVEKSDINLYNQLMA